MQMAGLTVQNFVSAAVGMAVAVALARGLARSGAQGRVGNFWVDLVRGVLRVLLPISVVGALVLVALGVVQNFDAPQVVGTLAGGTQTLTGGPVASQEAIKELGTNGGGFYNANSSHPFENPTPLSNLFEVYLILLIPLSMALHLRSARRRPPPGPGGPGGHVDPARAPRSASSPGPRWPHRAPHPPRRAAPWRARRSASARPASALFAAATTGTSTGAVNSMHDSLTAPGGAVTLFNMQLGEIAPGGVGSGLYGMLDARRRDGLPVRPDGRAAPRSSSARRSAGAR